MANKLYSYESNIAAPAADVFAYHERPVAIQRLSPPWEKIRILKQEGGIRDGGIAEIQMKVGPFNATWMARHQDYSENRQFVDLQVKGPFKYWKHTHSFRSITEKITTLKDTVQFELPFGALGHRFGYFKIRERLNKLFTYRHTITQNDLRHWMSLRMYPKCKVAITGGNGLIGSELAVFLQAQGHEVVILSRSGKSRIFGIEGARWEPQLKFIESNRLENVDCWIHLAGENLAEGRWTQRRIRKLKESRVKGTEFLVDYILGLKAPPKTFICASGIGYYPSGGSGELSEASERGSGVLADICDAWEKASERLDGSPIRRVIMRTGIVLSYKGGALRKMLPIFKSGAGGSLGPGNQYWSWIALDDLVRIYDWAIQDDRMKGVINAVAPLPVTNRQFTKELAHALKRPAFLTVPAVILRIALGRMADEALLASQKVIPNRLKEKEFNFHFPELELALSHCLGTY